MMHAMKSMLMLAGAVAIAGPPLQAQIEATGITGRWSQASTGKELVLAPRIKLVPNVGITAGTNLGGSVGYGSMTRTTVVTEPVMLEVARSMTLTVETDGRFQWSIIRRHEENQGCTITTTQMKHGRVARTGTMVTFAVAGGTETFKTSCGRIGSSRLAASTERYGMRQTGGALELVGGANRWRFARAS